MKLYNKFFLLLGGLSVGACNSTTAQVNTEDYDSGLGDTSVTDTVAKPEDGPLPDSSPPVSKGEICSSDGLCWANPLPQGHKLNSVWAASANDAWFVGEYGTIVHWNGTSTQSYKSGTTVNLRGIWNLSARDAWAVGDEGTALHWDGSNWTKIETGTKENLNAIWGSSASKRVWVVGNNGTILQWSDTFWTVQNKTNRNWHHIHGSSPDNIWVVGEGGATARWAGSNWGLGSFPTALNLRKVWTNGPDNAWVIYSSDTSPDTATKVYHWNRTNWNKQEFTMSLDSPLAHIWGNAINDIFIATVKGTIFHWDGTNWASSPNSLPSQAQETNWLGVWGSGSDIWAVGNNGYMTHFAGTQWDRIGRNITTNRIRSIWAYSPTQVWALASGNLICSWNGQTWNCTQPPSWASHDITQLWGVSPTDMWALGRTNGEIFHGDGTTWTLVHTDPQKIYWSISGSGSKDVWAVGSVISHWDGTSWKHDTTTIPAGGIVTSVSSSGPTNTWVGGFGGLAFQWNGSLWTAHPIPVAGGDLFGVWTSSANDTWVVGDNGVIYRWSGSAWGKQETKTFVMFNSVWGSSAQDVWVIGSNGTILRWNGTVLAPLVSGTPRLFSTIHGTSANNVWIGGQQGTILRY